MTDNKDDAIFEIDRNGTLKRVIDISEVKNPVELKTDAEGITWMYGERYALVLEGGEEMAVVTIGPGANKITRAEAAIYDLSGDPKGVAYKASEDALYWVSQTAPMRVVKTRINAQSGKLDTVWNKVVDNLPDVGLADIAVFPRLSSHLFLIGQSSQTIMEVDLTGPTAVLQSTFSFSAHPIPRAGAFAFDSNGSFRVVGKHAAGLPQDDFTLFVPTAPIPNLPPIADAGGNIDTIDFTGHGALVDVDSSLSTDPDGAIIDYQWLVGGVVVATGFGPKVPPLSRAFPVGLSMVTLIVRDDAQVISQTSVQVNVRQFTGAPEDHLPETFPQPAGYPADSLNYIHPGSLIPRAEFLFDLRETGFAEIWVYDQLGKEVTTFRTPTFPPGQYRAPWDLSNGAEPVHSGVYFVVIKTPGLVKKEKLVVVR